MKTPSILVCLVMAGFVAGRTTAMAQVPVIKTTNAAPQTPVSGAAPQAAAASAAPEANPSPPPAGPRQFSPAELEKLALPIALHPDPLIAIILPASVYPLEIVQAARFVKDTNNIPKVDDQDWDDNVKAVAKFPEMIAKMDADLPWTMALGEAFVNQPKELMDTMQALRGKAQKAGTLQNTPQQIVTVTNVVVLQTNYSEVVHVTNQIVQVKPSNPEVVYVPTYPPTAYYPPPGYVYSPYAPLVTFGLGMAAGAIIANNNCNWGGGSVDVDVDRNVNRNVNRNSDRANNTSRSTSQSGTRGANANATSRSGGTQQWKPDQSRMNKSGGASASAANSQARGWGGSSGANASSRPSTGTAASRPSTGNSAAARPSTGNSASRPSSGSSGGAGNRPSAGATPSTRPSTSQSSGRSSSPSASNRSSSGGSSAFSGGSASSARSSSSRGSASRGGGGGGGGGRGGGGGGGRR